MAMVDLEQLRKLVQEVGDSIIKDDSLDDEKEKKFKKSANHVVEIQHSSRQMDSDKRHEIYVNLLKTKFSPVQSNRKEKASTYLAEKARKSENNKPMIKIPLVDDENEENYCNVWANSPEPLLSPKKTQDREWTVSNELSYREAKADFQRNYDINLLSPATNAQHETLTEVSRPDLKVCKSSRRGQNKYIFEAEKGDLELDLSFGSPESDHQQQQNHVAADDRDFMILSLRKRLQEKDEEIIKLSLQLKALTDEIKQLRGSISLD